mmetsp:Transcript_15478/g.46465  ORF Transcript_15478/g.46465 Transcript_15478/m.46465 type:complete len:324 (-) Transcript_15478:901-1872(-)
MVIALPVATPAWLSVASCWSSVSLEFRRFRERNATLSAQRFFSTEGCLEMNSRMSVLCISTSLIRGSRPLRSGMLGARAAGGSSSTSCASCAGGLRGAEAFACGSRRGRLRSDSVAAPASGALASPGFAPGCTPWVCHRSRVACAFFLHSNVGGGDASLAPSPESSSPATRPTVVTIRDSRRSTLETGSLNSTVRHARRHSTCTRSHLSRTARPPAATKAARRGLGVRSSALSIPSRTRSVGAFRILCTNLPASSLPVMPSNSKAPFGGCGLAVVFGPSAGRLRSAAFVTLAAVNSCLLDQGTSPSTRPCGRPPSRFSRLTCC